MYVDEGWTRLERQKEERSRHSKWKEAHAREVLKPDHRGPGGDWQKLQLRRDQALQPGPKGGGTGQP